MARLILILISGWMFPLVAHSGDPCPPAGYTTQQLLEIKQAGFEVDSDEQRNALAIALMACLAEPDPAIRDGVVFEGTALWLRNKKLSTETIDVLYADLLSQLASDSDPNGFQQPFAALLLSEVARTDRVDETFNPERRDELVQAAAGYLAAVRDYRGYSETEGWRHGVAHGADLVLQLVLNPNTGAEQQRQLLAAVAAQVSPAGEVFYIYGESARLARAVFYAHRGGLLNEAEWTDWFAAIADPAPLDAWGSSFSSQSGLAKRHNTLAFLLAMHLNASASEGEQAEALAAMVMQAIGRVLGG
jgi:hypothetical protein